MIGLIGTLGRLVFGSFIGRITAAALAGLTALTLNNMYQRSVGAKNERVEIVENSNEVAKKRDAEIRKDRRRRKPGAGRKRLLNTYTRSD